GGAFLAGVHVHRAHVDVGVVVVGGDVQAGQVDVGAVALAVVGRDVHAAAAHRDPVALFLVVVLLGAADVAQGVLGRLLGGGRRGAGAFAAGLGDGGGLRPLGRGRLLVGDLFGLQLL